MSELSFRHRSEGYRDLVSLYSRSVPPGPAMTGMPQPLWGASGFSVGDFGERQFASGDLSSVATMVRWKIPTSIVTYSASAHHGK
jgi:hypothetical protein